MTALESYSPLESLLLFQALSAFGTHADVFDKVSQSLRNCAAIQEVAANDDDRFEPDSLKDLYLTLLKEDAKQELLAKSEAEEATQNGDIVSYSRKRKIASPKLRTVEDASHHVHLMPKTVARLYAKYQEQIISEIKADERTFDALTDEARSTQEQTAPTPSRPNKSLNEGVNGALFDAGIKPQAANPAEGFTSLDQSQHPSSSVFVASASHPSNDSVDKAKTKIDAIINHDDIDQENAAPHPQQSRQHGDDKNLADNRKAVLPIPGTAQEVLPQSPSYHNQPLPSSSERVLHNSSISQAQTQASHASPYQYRSSQAEVITPLPGTRPPQQSLPPVTRRFSPNQDLAASTGGATSTVSNYPVPHKSSLLEATNQEQSQQQTYPTYQNTLAQVSHHQPYQYPPPQNQPQVVPAPPPKGGVLLQPFQVTPQAPSNAHQYPRPTPATAPAVRPPSHLSTPLQQGERSPTSYEQVANYATGSKDPQTPLSVPGRQNLRQAGATNSPGSATAWKIHIPAVTGRRPLPEDISPVDEDTTFKFDSGDATSQVGPSNQQVPGVKSSTSQQKPRGRSRSSATDDVAASSFTAGSRKVKAEPSTPMSTTEQDSNLSTIRPTRYPSSKRKRENEELYDDHMSPPGSPRRDSHSITAYKNFDKMTQHLLENITSHKHAGIFANPVRDKDAKGYSDTIRRPQDLKSIRNAIRAGSKAVAQASNDVLQNSPGPGGGASGMAGTVTLPFSEDFVPPRGIVNPSQLECELTRMFANAVMFNPGNEYVVQETRDMFEDVEQIMSSWRSTEKSSERQESAEAVEDGSTSVKKRRM